jgi:hypothetical protein
MSKYRAREGQEDRHGEMTGAITFNMIFVMGPLIVWCVFVGPIWLTTSEVLWSGLVIGLVLCAVGFPISRFFWARFSDWADRT